ncbi:MAG TPA: division/cell wall cluster transcriptional repressor MraZ [Planctomycetaceae bacterium]|nr:division/cell wall cluster transcriptional repressor MraZ [Planctomycetaceae bacterium]
MGDVKLILGEFSRKLDDRFRLSLPAEFSELFHPEEGNCVLVKERSGCVSLWDRKIWQEEMDTRVEIVRQRLKLRDLNRKMSELQAFGRLLSTKSRPIQLAERGRLVIPEGFREFLGVEAEKEVMVVGAAVCLEIWQPQKWIAYVEGRMPKFRRLLDKLSN